MTEQGKAKTKNTGSITKLIVSMLLFNTLIILVVTLLISTWFFFRQVNSIYDDMNKAIVGEAFSQIDDDLIEDLANTCHGVFSGIDNPRELFSNNKDEYYKRFTEISKTEKYKDLQDMLKHLCAGTQASEIDMVILYPKEEMGIYIVDAREVELIKCGELFDIEKKYFDEQTQTFKGFYSQSRFFGRVWTSGIPVYNNTAKGFSVYITADIPTKVINGQVFGYIVRLAAFSLLFGVLISVGFAFSSRRDLVRPVKEISGLAESFMDGYDKRTKSGGRSDVFSKVDPGKIDEINVLLKSMQTMESEMNGYLEDLKTATAEKERISLELDLASKIQAAMIPSIFPPFPERKEFSIYASMTPAKEVGGDFYDFFLIDDDHLGIVMADVSGKGIPAALLMMVTKIIVKNYTLMHNSPSKVLELVNNQICSNNQAEMFVTVWLGILTISEGRVVASNAGHEYPIIKKGSGSFEVLKDKHGFVIGGLEDSKYTEYEFFLGKGDTLFVYTDGLLESTNSSEELFGMDRILEHLNITKDANPEMILDHMKNAVKGFVGEAQQFDDLTMLAIKLLEKPSNSVDN